jgi:hypothetical protein
MSTSPQIISGTPATVADLGKDQAWLQGWLKEGPSRLGLGELSITDGAPVQDEDGNPAFLASDEEHTFCVDVRLGELEAAHGFGVLHNWARNRVRHPDGNHVAVLVTESTGERYRSTLEALTQHLPLIVIELRAWRGEREAIIVPHVALASGDVDLSGRSAAAAEVAAASDTTHEATDDGAPDARSHPIEGTTQRGSIEATPTTPRPGSSGDGNGTTTDGGQPTSDAKPATGDAKPTVSEAKPAMGGATPRPALVDGTSQPSAPADARSAASDPPGKAAAVPAAGASPSEDKDDTGIADPWRLSRKVEAEPDSSTDGTPAGTASRGR